MILDISTTSALDQFTLKYGLAIISFLFIACGTGLGWFFNKIINRLERIEDKFDSYSEQNAKDHSFVQKEVAIMKHSQASISTDLNGLSENIERLSDELREIQKDVAILMDRERESQ